MRKWFSLTTIQVMAAANRPIPTPPPPEIPLEIVHVNNSADPVLECGIPARRLAYARECLELGDFATIAVSEGTVVGWVWAASRSHRDPTTRLRINLAPGEVYIYDAWIVEPHRRHGVFQMMYTAMCNELFERQLAKRIVCYVLKSNPAIQQAILPFGFEQVQQTKFLTILIRYGFQIPLTARPRHDEPLSRGVRSPLDTWN